MARIAGAVLAGYFTISILAFLTEPILAAALPGLRTLPALPLGYYAAVTGTDTLYSIAGGYLCAAIAGASAGRATLALTVLSAIASLVAIAWFRAYLPPWFSLAMLVLLPLGVRVGSRLRSHQSG